MVIIELYNNKIIVSKELMEQKNHDYGEAWRDMRISSLTDLILMKVLRVKQIEDNKGKTLISEGIDANYFDMINYSVFAMIPILNNMNKKIFAIWLIRIVIAILFLVSTYAKIYHEPSAITVL